VTIKNRLPLALSYDSNDAPSGLAEFQISSVDLADVATDHPPSQYQVLAWSAVGDGTFLYAPSTVETGGGGGGVSFPTGSTGDILYYPTGGTSVTSIDPTTTPLNLATTGIVKSASDALVPRDGTVTVEGPVTFSENQPLFPIGLNVTGPVNVTGPFTFTGPGSFTVDGSNVLTLPTGGSNGDVLTKGPGGAMFTTPATLATEGGYATTAAYATTALVDTTSGLLLTKTEAGSFSATLLPRTEAAGFSATLLTKNEADGFSSTLLPKTEAAGFSATLLPRTEAAGFSGTLLTKTEADAFSSTLVTNAEYNTSSSLFVATSITTAATRTFLGTDAKLGNLSDVSVGSPEHGEVLKYRSGANVWESGVLTLAPNGVAALTVSAEEGNFTLSNVLTTPIGTTGKGDSTANSFVFVSGTDASATEFVGTRWGANWVEGPQNIETTNGNYFAYVSATPTGDAPGSSGVAAVALNANALEFIENGSATNVSANSVNISDLNVTRVGQMNPTTYIQEGDWLTPGAAANGFGSSQVGTGAGFGQCFDNDVMHPDKGTFGVYEIRSGSDAYGRTFLTTFNNAIAVSSCAISFTSRIAPSGLWVAGHNDGKMSFGIRNGTDNAEPAYAMEFQYGQATGKGGNNWSAVVVDNSNSTVSDTGIAASGQEFQVLQVSCNENWQNVDFYVDGVLKASFNIADHNIPDSRYNRLGCAWSINNANIFSSSNQTVGNEIFLDWHQLRMTHNDTTRGRDLIK
jgi:hypothetical protein